MSLMRRFSNRVMGRGSDDAKTNEGSRRRRRDSARRHPVQLEDPPKEVKPQSSLALFRPRESSSGDATKDIQRTLFEMPMPQNTDAMTDLIKLHKKGDSFPYVGVVGNEGETPDARRSRLLALKPSYNMRHIPEIAVMDCPLIDPNGQFTMSDLMEFAKQSTEPVQPQGPRPTGHSLKDFSISKRYVHVSSVTALFTPNVSSTSDYCKFWLSLEDTRLVNSSKSGQTNAIVSNQEGVLEMSCDYCVSVNDLSSFVLAYTMEREIVKPGFQWGTLNFFFNITESDIPFQTSKKDALAVYRMPITTLLERETNADISDISFTPQDVARLREMFKEGDIVDVDQPQTMRAKKSSYSKSTIRGPKGEQLDNSISKRPGWEMMQNARKPMVDAAEASVSAKDDLDEDDDDDRQESRMLAKDAWEKEQEEMRKAFIEKVEEESVTQEKEVVPREITPELNHQNSLERLFKRKGPVRFDESGV